MSVVLVRNPNVNWVNISNDKNRLFCKIDDKYEIFNLNKSGFKIWINLDEATSKEELISKLALKKGISYEDVYDFLYLLEKHNLVLVSSKKSNPKNNIIAFYKKLNNTIYTRPQFKKVSKRLLKGEKLLHDPYITRTIFGSNNLKYRPFYPMRVDIDLTYSCNLNCSFCYVEEKSKGVLPNPFKIKQIISKIAKLNIDHISFLGGEPFLDPNLLDYIKYANSKGMKITVNTNGTLSEIIPKLKGLNIELLVSLDGSNKKIQDSIRGEGTFDKIMKTIKVAKQNGIEVILSHTITRRNYLDLIPYYFMATRNKINIIYTRFFIESGEGKKNIHENGISYFHFIISKFEQFIIHILSKILKSKGYFTFPINRCNAKTYYNVGPQGEARFCNIYDKKAVLGNILKTGPLEVWHSKTFKNIHRLDLRKEPCKSCLFKDYCGSDCKAAIYGKTGDHFAGNEFCIRGKISKLFTIKLK